MICTDRFKLGEEERTPARYEKYIKCAIGKQWRVCEEHLQHILVLEKPDFCPRSMLHNVCAEDHFKPSLGFE